MSFTRIALAVALVAGVSACSAERVVDNTVDAGLFATKTVVKTGVGAGKLVVRGTHAALSDD
ncbi:hypothetical protein [Jannaschia marina]|uniref:hypothetical protein n=1 Tax=Jannaschia marina TaxID=2741674 RepID=UPI0015CE8D12|nr:hypothetical protein [Jannaschia marina]